MDKNIMTKARKINYYPLMWVLLISSLFAILSFFFKAFVIYDYYGEDVIVYAYNILDRTNDSVINLSEFSLLKNTILIALSLGIVNVCMSLWQVGYSNARRMKLINSLRFTITACILIVLIFLTDATSNGQIMMKDTVTGALGFNCLIYLFAYLFNLYYGVSDRVAIINYKAINAVALLIGCFFFMMNFISINGVSVLGVNAIYFPNILGLNNSSLVDLVKGHMLYGILSRVFLYKFAHNLLWNLVFVLTNKSYGRFNLVKYIYSAAYSIFFAYYCVYIVGSSIEGIIGIICITILYIVLALYTLFSYRILKRKVYSSEREEMMYDDDDKYYDEESRFIGNLPNTLYENNDSEIVSIENKNGDRGITAVYSNGKHKTENTLETKEEEKIVEEIKKEEDKKTDVFTPSLLSYQRKAKADLSRFLDDDYGIEDEIKIVYTSNINEARAEDQPLIIIDGISEKDEEKDLKDNLISLSDYNIEKVEIAQFIPEEYEVEAKEESVNEEAKESPIVEDNQILERKTPEELEMEEEEEDIDGFLRSVNEKDNTIIIDSDSKECINEDFIQDEIQEQINETEEITENNIDTEEDINIDENQINKEEILENTIEEGLIVEELIVEEIVDEESIEDYNLSEDIDLYVTDISNEDEAIEISELESAEINEIIIEQDIETLTAEDSETEELETTIVRENTNEQEQLNSENALSAAISIEVNNEENLIISEVIEDDSEEIEDLEEEILYIETLEDEEEILQDATEIAIKEQDEIIEDNNSQLEDKLNETIAPTISYKQILKLMEEDPDSEVLNDYNRRKRANTSISNDKVEETDREQIENLVTEDFMPENIRLVIEDSFYNSMPYKNKKEFTNLFMNPNNLLFSKLPQYLMYGDNSLFFARVIKYSGVLGGKISTELLLLLYEFVLSLYNEDTEFISNCTRCILDACYNRSDREQNAIHISEELCIKEIKMMLKTDLDKTMPIIKRLILIYTRQGKYEEAIQLCDTAIRLNFKDNTIGGYQGRKYRIMRLMEKSKSI